MVSEFREFLRTKAGRGVAIAGAVLALVFAAVVTRNSLGDSPAATSSRERMYICAETGKAFEHEIEMGERNPVYSPHSGKNTGYPAELCFWTKEGTPGKSPTYVLLNQYARKSGPTFCPDCGRLVMPMNPPPLPGEAAPPTQAEFKLQRAG